MAWKLPQFEEMKHPRGAHGTFTFKSNDPTRPSASISVTGTGALAIHGNTSTYTWTTESFNSASPSYLGIGFRGLGKASIASASTRTTMREALGSLPITVDNHNSLVNGFASLTFNPVNATGIRVGFTSASTTIASTNSIPTAEQGRPRW